MPDGRLARTRRAYTDAPTWRRPSETDAEQLQRRETTGYPKCGVGITVRLIAPNRFRIGK